MKNGSRQANAELEFDKAVQRYCTATGQLPGNEYGKFSIDTSIAILRAREGRIAEADAKFNGTIAASLESSGNNVPSDSKCEECFCQYAKLLRSMPPSR